MTEDKELNTLIEGLVTGARPVKRLWQPVKRTLVWFSFCFGLSLLLVHLTGDFRAGFMDDFVSSPRFLLEVVLGALSGIVAAWYGFEMAVPGRNWTGRDKLLSTLPFLLFCSLVIYGYFDPAIKPSWAGWRFGCEIEILLFGALPMITFFFLARKAAPIEGQWTGFLIAIASMAPSVTLMHLACMYDFWHVLGFHIGPVIVASMVATRVAPRLFKV